MKWFTLIFILSFSLSTFAIEEQAATGFELGVARISDGTRALIGTSWMYHFEYQADPYVGIFGQAGQSQAKDETDQFKQNSFVGGMKFTLLPILEARAGVATEILDVKTQDDHFTGTELGPMVALATSVDIGVFKFGTSATVIRTRHLNSTALRAVLFLIF